MIMNRFAARSLRPESLSPRAIPCGLDERRGGASQEDSTGRCNTLVWRDGAVVSGLLKSSSKVEADSLNGRPDGFPKRARASMVGAESVRCAADARGRIAAKFSSPGKHSREFADNGR